MNARQRKILGLGFLAATLVSFVPSLWKMASFPLPVKPPETNEMTAGRVLYGKPSLEMQVEIEPSGKLLIVGTIVAATLAIAYLRRTPTA